MDKVAQLVEHRTEGTEVAGSRPELVKDPLLGSVANTPNSFIGDKFVGRPRLATTRGKAGEVSLCGKGSGQWRPYR